MMRSLSSAVAGLRTHQTKMDVIGNNIANVNTYGYKASRTTFADIYYQNLSRGAGPVTTVGGTNPTQIGYGSAIATIDVLNTQAGAASTDRAMDVYITGEGFLVTQDAMGNYLYTRLGNLGFDAAGNLVDGTGKFVLGFPQDENGAPLISEDGTIMGDEMQRIQVDPALLDQLTGISIGAGGEIIGILPGNTNVTLGSAVPGWIDLPTVPIESNLQGPVNMIVGALPDMLELNNALHAQFAALGQTDPTGGEDFITDIDFGDVSIAPGANMQITTTPNGRMTVNVDVISNTGKRSPMKAEGVLENGKIVLKSGSDTLMTLTVNPDLDFPDTSGVTTTTNTNPITIGTTDIPDYRLSPATTKYLKGVDGEPIRMYDGMIPSGGRMKLTSGGAPIPYYWDAAGNMTTVLADAADTDTDGEPDLAWYTEDGTKTGDPITGNIPVYQIVKSDGSVMNPMDVAKAAWDPDDDGTFDAPVPSVFKDAKGNVPVDADGDPIPMYATDRPATIVVDETGAPLLSTTDAPNAFTVGTGQLMYQLSTTDKGGNIRMSGEEVDNPGPQSFTDLVPDPITGLYEIQLGDSYFYLNEAQLTNFAGTVARIGMTEGEKINIGCIALAKFANAAGLQQVGNTQYMTTENTGDVTYNKPDTNGVGGLKANYLEMSNVDISKEFTDMITTQRGFQANTRIVTVSDEMLNELVNLKR